MKNLAKDIIIEVGEILHGLTRVRDTEALAILLRRMGWRIKEEEVAGLQAAIDALPPLWEILEALWEIAESLADDNYANTSLQNVIKDLVKRVKKVTTELPKFLKVLETQLRRLPDSGWATPPDVETLRVRLIDRLVVDHLLFKYPVRAAWARLLGVYVETESGFTRIRWGELPSLLFRPHQAIPDFYNWGQDEVFAFTELIDHLLALLHRMRIPAGMYDLPENYAPAPPSGVYRELRIPLYTEQLATLPDAGVHLNIRPHGNHAPGALGLLTRLHLTGLTSLSEFYTDEYVHISVKGLESVPTGVGLSLGPSAGADLSLESDGAAPEFRVEITPTESETTPERTVLVGDGTATHLGFDAMNWSAGVSLDKNRPDLDLKIEFSGLSAIVGSRDRKGLVAQLLGNNGLRVGGDVAAAYSLREGLKLSGSAELMLKIPINKKLGPAELHYFTLSINPGPKTEVRFEFSFDAKLGPINLAAEKTGLQFSIGTGGGNFGPLDLGDLTFSPPQAMGLDLDAGIIGGGGFLRRYPEDEAYAGALKLNLAGIDIQAVGIIQTRMPNGEKGFSLLISITTFFRPAIQLSFGFTLNAVGGILGLNRTLRVDELRRRLLAGSLEKIMFPKDVIKNAPAIIDSLRAILPAKKGHFVVAPLLKIGWGTPTIIEVDLGVFLEFPFRGRIILLGRVAIALPAKKAALVKINVDILGDFNFANRYIRIEGRLTNSKLVGIPLTGGFAFVLGWSGRPQFLMSVGGYHPGYKKPALFPKIPRLNATIKRGSSLVISCNYYQAVSSNSYQIGAAADLKASVKIASVDAHFSFDALLQFDPFYFEFASRMSVNVRVKGKRLAGIGFEFLLSGPKPWKISGYAKIKVLFIKIKIRLRKEWGGRQRVAPPRMDAVVLLGQLADALAERKNWTLEQPRGYRAVESFRELPEGEDAPVSPIHYLSLRQPVLPLNYRVTHFGKAEVTGAPTFRLRSVKAGTTELISSASTRVVNEYFAPGQYRALSQKDQLSSPDFESRAAGISLLNLFGFELEEGMEECRLDFEVETPPVSRARKSAGTISAKRPKASEATPAVRPSSPTAGRRITRRYGLVKDFPEIPAFETPKKP